MKLSPKFLASKLHVFPLALGLLWMCSSLSSVQAARRPGAPRLMRFNWSDGSGRNGAPDSLYQGVFSNRPARSGADNWTLYFTREDNGTRNLWRAVPEESREQPAPKPVQEDGANEAARDAPVRNVAWRATPLTRLTGAFFAEQAAPAPDGRTLLCVTNAADLRGNNYLRKQIARVDLNSGALTALTKNPFDNHSPAIAPNGRRFAFVSERDGAAAVYVMPIEGGTAWRMAAPARRPFWLDDSTLVFESARPGQAGLYKITVPETSAMSTGGSRPQQLFARAGEAALAPDGAVLAVANPMTIAAEDGSQRIESRLSLLAPDGSGERVVPGTEGAGAPAFAPDGSAIIFDAPIASGGAKVTGATGRALWLLPMLRMPPTASILGVRLAQPSGLTATANDGPAKIAGVEVLGTVFAEDIAVPDIKLEMGDGKEPETWKSLPIKQQPVHEGVLTTLLLPMDEPGELTLRLTVTDASGDASQSTWTLELPLEAAPPNATAPIFAATFPTGVLPSEVTPDAPTAAAVVSPTPVSPIPTRTPQSPRLPAPAPLRVLTNPQSSGAMVISAPVPTSPALPNPHWIPEPSPTPNASAPAAVTAGGQPLPSLPTGVASRNPTGRTVKPVTSKSGGLSGWVSVRGTPATMTTGASVPVVATIRNTGKQAWPWNGSQAVRLIYRWVTEGSRTRIRWALVWLRQPLPPGGMARLSFNLTAPPRPGRYRLTYSLVRLNGTEYEPPSFKGRQDRWPGEFAGITYAVVVR